MKTVKEIVSEILSNLWNYVNMTGNVRLIKLEQPPLVERELM